jgi:hypothetical protein
MESMKLSILFRALTKSLGLTAALGVASIGCGPTTADGSLAPAALTAAQTAWSETVSAAPSTEAGCFHVSYPSTTWENVECGQAPSPSAPPPSASGGSETVGNGADYAAKAAGIISKSIGTFPKVTDVKTENDDGTANTYSIQLNSNFLSGTNACHGDSGCQSWTQFVYSSSQGSAFIQNWLIGASACPSGWNDLGGGNCYVNSAAASVPQIPIASLSTLKMSGSATSSKDSLVFTAKGDAYSTSQADSLTGLSTAWNESEFNIIGDGGGSTAVFNTGSSITVKVALTDGSKTAPTCVSNGGTTGETNDLTLGTCKTKGGTSPYIEFTESR